ncbi:hypothetical protein T08_3571 [Trichinella sp. T8]|nr:hypothetical protein T08_3571 [Trichinella sp. T8]
MRSLISEGLKLPYCRNICAYTLYLPYLKTTFGNLHFILSRGQAHQVDGLVPHLALTRRYNWSDNCLKGGFPDAELIEEMKLKKRNSSAAFRYFLYSMVGKGCEVSVFDVESNVPDKQVEREKLPVEYAAFPFVICKLPTEQGKRLPVVVDQLF